MHLLRPLEVILIEEALAELIVDAQLSVRGIGQDRVLKGVQQK